MKRAISIRKKHFSYPMFFIIMILVVLGTIIISSASAVVSFQDYGDSLYLFKRQILNVAIGLFFMWFFYKTDVNTWKKYSFHFFVASIIFLIAVFIPYLGIRHGGATRWIGIGFASFQPSEFLKFALIIYFASLFEKKGFEIKDLFHGLVPFISILALIGLLIMFQPDLGTLLVILVISGTMFFVSGARLAHIFFLLTLGFSAILFLIKFSSYRMQRFTVFLDPEKHAQGIGYQISQALLAIGSGGVWGLGFGQSRQKHQYLPEPDTDSIFAIFSEEKGMVGAIFILLLFVILGYLGFTLARRTQDPYKRLLVVGITAWIVFQAFLNISAILSLVPLTGVPLPFISYGGSSIIFMLSACGILLNISSNTVRSENENSSFRRGNGRSHSAGVGSD